MTGKGYTFEKVLARAATPPAGWYTDPEMLEREKQRIFSRTWQLVGDTDSVAEPGQYFTTMIGNDPIIVVRDNERRLRAFSNVCRHRAGPVAADRGQRRTFQCGYHGWTYGLDGRLLGTPEFDGVECWAKEENALPEFQIDNWNKLIFVNADKNAGPLSQTVEGVESLLGERHEWDRMRLAARKEWHVECNWKVYVDNYLEGYHIPVVHPTLNRQIDYGQYCTETGRYHSVQYSPFRDDVNAKSGADVLYVWLFPNLMLNVYRDNYSTNLIVPTGPERTLTIFEWYFSEPGRREVQEAVDRTVAFSDQIQREDISICEAVQRGLRSSRYDSGRYCVKRENGVHHFHGLLAEFLGFTE